MQTQKNLERDKTIVLFTVGLLFSAALAYILSNQETILIRSDHFSRWYAAHNLIAEQRSIYDPRNGQEVVSFNTIPYNPIEGSFFYPAHLLIFLLPFAKLPYIYAHFFWLILIQGFLLCGILIVYRTTHWPRSANQLALLVFLSLFFIPNLQNTIWGQFNTISVFALPLVYKALRGKRYLISGILAVGLTFKPQTMMLTLLFLLFWASFQRKRWGFLLGFGITCLGFWLLAEHFEPNWVTGFIHSVKAYSDYLHPQSVLNQFGVQNWMAIGILGAVVFWVFIKNAHCDPESVPFSGCLVLSLGVWWIAVPVLGMMHLVALPIAVVLLFSAIEKRAMKTYHFGLIAIVVLYVLGLLGFIYGLSTPGDYGLHIQLAELALKLSIPILVVILAFPLCITRSGDQEPKTLHSKMKTSALS